jgi:hypothetical protein
MLRRRPPAGDSDRQALRIVSTVPDAGWSS